MKRIVVKTYSDGQKYLIVVIGRGSKIRYSCYGTRIIYSRSWFYDCFQTSLWVALQSSVIIWPKKATWAMCQCGVILSRKFKEVPSL